MGSEIDIETVIQSGPPKLDAVFDYPEKLVELGLASNALFASAARYQTLAVSTWWSSWFEHSTRRIPDSSTDVLEYVDQGIASANQALLQLQHSEPYLEAQRVFIKQLAQYRERERKVAEVWQDWSHTPTRAHVDDVTETVYELRREMRKLKRELARQGSPEQV